MTHQVEKGTIRLSDDADSAATANRRGIKKNGDKKMNQSILTTTIRGIEVLAKTYEGMTLAVTYSNRTQANKKAAQMGNGWTVYQFGRPFYVGKVKDPAIAIQVGIHSTNI